MDYNNPSNPYSNQPTNQQGYYPNQYPAQYLPQNPYAGQPNDYAPQNQYAPRRVNLLELLLVIIVLIVWIVVFVWGFATNGTKNVDLKRKFDIEQVLTALNTYYLDSSSIPSERFYPISQCQEKPNEVDYEYTLRKALTNATTDNFSSYISDNNFPNDPTGVYAKTLGERKFALKDCPSVYGQSPADSIYQNSWKSCNFSTIDKKYYQCYLYTSYQNGEKFELSYYSQSEAKFKIYSKFRDRPVQLESVVI